MEDINQTASSLSLLLDKSILINIIILAMMLLTAICIVVMRHLFSIAMVSGVYSLLSAIFFMNLDAVDVAFTEAAVGAGMSTILVLGGLLLTSRREALTPGHSPLIPLLVVFVMGAGLFYASFDMPAFADKDSPVNTGVGMEYIDRNAKEIGIPNVVTSVLASYRGMDTLGETVVVFVAGLGVLILLGVSRSGQTRHDDDETQI